MVLLHVSFNSLKFLKFYSDNNIKIKNLLFGLGRFLNWFVARKMISIIKLIQIIASLFSKELDYTNIFTYLHNIYIILHNILHNITYLHNI